MITVKLPYPDKALSPNARVHWGRKAAAVKAARKEAYFATKAAGGTIGDGPYAVSIMVYPRSRGVRGDADGVVSCCKAALDGIADALGVNDRHFLAPTVEFSDKREGRIEITIKGKNE